MDSEVKHIASCLCVVCGKITIDKENQVPVVQDPKGKGEPVTGLGTVAKHLARKAANKDLLGRTPFDKAVVDQWLEYRCTQLDRCRQDKDTQAVLAELDGYLSDRVYLVGFYFTVADLVLYLGLHSVFSDLSFYDKQKYLHLSRWFDQVQHTKGVQQNLKKIYFQKNLIYSKDSAH